jgi:hypothetical protein
MSHSGALAAALVAFLKEHRRCWLLYAPDIPSLNGRDGGIYENSLGPFGFIPPLLWVRC